MKAVAAAAAFSRVWDCRICTSRDPITTASDTRPTAFAVADVSDAVVIGSALVQLLETRERGNVAAAAADFIGGIRAALDS